MVSVVLMVAMVFAVVVTLLSVNVHRPLLTYLDVHRRLSTYVDVRPPMATDASHVDLRQLTSSHRLMSANVDGRQRAWTDIDVRRRGRPSTSINDGKFPFFLEGGDAVSEKMLIQMLVGETDQVRLLLASEFPRTRLRQYSGGMDDATTMTIFFFFRPKKNSSLSLPPLSAFQLSQRNPHQAVD